MDVANLAISGTSLVLSAAQTLFAALQCDDVQEICSYLGYDKELESLQNTVEAVNAVLLDAEEKQVLNHQHLNYLQKLTDAVYKADDLLDEFTAYAEQQHNQLLKGGKVSKKVRLLFSHFGELGVARKMSKNVKKIRQELDGIASDANKFCFKFDHEPIRIRREETCSYAHEKDVIGREKETEDIINMLLPSHADNNEIQGNNLSVLAIVGMGGLGKTTLAQVVFENKRVTSEFQLRIWVCVSDQDQKQLPLQQILEKIINSAEGSKQQQHGSEIELVQRQLRDVLHDKKYLLVLDDLWSEDHHQLLELEKFLRVGGSGSKVVVTTRSKETARAVGCFTPYVLQGLSPENSWHLFEKIAFETKGQKENHELENIGRDIVKKCANVPLSIRVVGSLLYGQGREKWLQFQHHGLSMLTNHGNPIIQILKFSYFQLSSSLKSCFGYCAVFPKDLVIKKEKLIRLWMAQGFGESLTGIQCTEDVFEEYFSILLRRCFFQDVTLDMMGEIVSCKMHDLVHDMALEVAGNETFCMMDSATRSLDKRIRHVSYDMNHVYLESCFNESRVRSFMGAHISKCIYFKNRFPLNILMARWRYLRVLDLSWSSFQFLPEDTCSLIHLRYLDISHNDNLEKISKSISRLHYLQTLKMKYCVKLKELPKELGKLSKLSQLDVKGSGLKSMPPGMGKLTFLRRLSMFVVSVRDLVSKQEASDLEDLRALKDLKGKLQVVVKEGYKYDKQGKEGGYLSNKEHLCKIEIRFGGRMEGEEELLEDLQPHRNIKVLSLYGYCGVRKPRMSLYTSLRCLRLEKLPNVKSISGIGLEHLTALEELVLRDLPSLRLDDEDEEGGMPWKCLHHCLRHLRLMNLPKMHKMPKGMQHLTSLQLLQIERLKMEGGLPEWMGCLSSLQTLFIFDQKEIETIATWMQQLTSLTHLFMIRCSEKLNKRCQSPNGEDWPLIRHIHNIHIL